MKQNASLAHWYYNCSLKEPARIIGIQYTASIGNTMAVENGTKHMREKGRQPSSSPPIKRRCAIPLVNNYGQTKLHQLTKHTNVSDEEIKKCLKEHPEAVRMVDFYGRTPLFYAVKQNCSLSVFEILFDVYPDGLVQVDMMGHTALAMLYHASKPVTLLAYVCKRQPSLMLLRGNSFSARKWVDSVCDAWSKLDVACVDDDQKGWAKLLLTIDAAHRATFGQAIGQKEELHIALELGLCSNLLCKFVQLYPLQLQREMSRSHCKLPLHHVLTTQTFDLTDDSGATLICCMLAAFSLAASIGDCDGRFPLHLALARGCQWATSGVKEIVYAAPKTLHTADPLSGLCPVLTAAASDVCSLDTVFCLLRESPLGFSHFSS